MNYRTIALLLAAGSAASAQIAQYLGPGVLSRGAGDIGARGGQDLDVRLFASLTGIYDQGLQPVQVNDEGQLVRANGLYGVQAGFGAYGRHEWRQSQLGLDYAGNYRYYRNSSFYTGTNHQLSLGFTHQRSRRLIFDFRESAGTVSQGNGFIGGLPIIDDSIVDQNTLLFDNRVNYVQTGMDMSLLMSARTSLTAGGTGYTIRRESSALVDMNGYELHGSIQHRLSQFTTVGLNFRHTHFDYPGHFGESDVDALQGELASGMGPFWTISLSGGLYQVQTQGAQRVSLDPSIAALLGTRFTLESFFRHNVIPYGNIVLSRTFQNASWRVSYTRGISGGNGVFLTSRQESINSGFSFVGTRLWSFSVNVGYSTLRSVGQRLEPYRQTWGGINANYAITPALHFNAGYQIRNQNITNGLDADTFRRTSARVTIGLSYSPGDVPLSFH